MRGLSFGRAVVVVTVAAGGLVSGPSASAATTPSFASCAALAVWATVDYAAAGPHEVGWRDEVLPFLPGVTITDRVYYPAQAAGEATPAEPAGGPYPIVAMIHGSSGDPDFYDELSIHIASHGYVVASLGGMSSFNESHLNMATETMELVDWVTAQSADVASPYSGLAVDGDYVAVGHSRGGAAAQYLIGLDPRVIAVAGLEPSFVNNITPLGNIASWDGHWLFVAGEVDTINPVSEVKNILKKATGATRRVFVKILGAGHAGPIDPDIPGVGGDPMPHDEQLKLHKWMTTAYIEAELRGIEDAYHQIIGGAAQVDDLEHESTCPEPALWVVEQDITNPSSITFGLAGSRNDVALIAVSPSAASIPTQYGDLLIDPLAVGVLTVVQLTTEGTTELVVPVPASAAGLVLHAQGLVLYLGGGGAFSRMDPLVVP